MDSAKNRKYTLVLAMLSLGVVATALVSLSLGSVSIPLREVLLSLVGRNDTGSELIIMQFRLPRILAALLVGAALAVSGGLFQGVIRNPLASPDLLGVTGGASVAAVAFMTLFTGYSIHWLPFVAVVGAFGAAAVNYVLAWSRGVTPLRLVLIGIGVSAAFGALTTFLLISGPAYLAAQVLNWMTGSIYGTNWLYVKALWPWLAVLVPIALWQARELNIQSLGEASAIGLGSRVQRSRLVILAIGVALAGAAVGVAGTLSLIALLAPHMARLLIGASYVRLLPVSALLGAFVLLLADLAGRMLFMPLDIPAGVFTAGAGAPFFLYLLFRNRGRGAAV